MVWAWRAGRARRMARWYDHLMALLPFEPPYFERVGLACQLCRPSGARQRRRSRRRARGFAPRTGSRADETADRGVAGQPRRRGAPAAAGLRRGAGAARSAWSARFASRCRRSRRSPTRSREAVRDWPGRPIVLRDPRDKYDAFAASRAALAASGTVALELAMARLPMVVCLSPQPADRGAARPRRQGAAGQSGQPAARPAGGPRAVARRLRPRAARRRRSPADPGRTGSRRASCGL